jgi:leukotriene-A4 hydrolase
MVLHLGLVYDLSSTLNTEIRARYYELALDSPAAGDIKELVAEWVVDDAFQSGGVKGRMKFCRPIFRALAKVDKELATQTFKNHQECFHPIARRLIEKVRQYLRCTIAF